MENKKMRKLGHGGSIIRKISEYGNKLKKQHGADKVFDFSIGNPSVACPKIVSDEIVRLTTSLDPITLHSYTSANGLEETRLAIANYLNNKYQSDVDSNLIYLTSGASAALAITFKALLNKNDEVVVIAPYFPEYQIFVENASGKLVVSKANQKTFLPDFADLKEKITFKTKAILIDSPNNPTGVFYDQEVIIKLTNLLKEKEIEYQHEIYLISDEPYRELLYVDKEYPFITNYYHDSLVCYSFSKSLSLPGERVGYLIVGSQCFQKERLYEAICGAGRALGYICISNLFQHLLPTCLNYTSDLSVYKHNRDLLYQGLLELGYESIYPDGAFYLFVKALEEDAVYFANVAKKYRILVVPGDSFGQKGYVRISYCVDTDLIINSLKAFKKLKEYYDGGQNHERH